MVISLQFVEKLHHSNDMSWIQEEECEKYTALEGEWVLVSD